MVASFLFIVGYGLALLGAYPSHSLYLSDGKWCFGQVFEHFSLLHHAKMVFSLLLLTISLCWSRIRISAISDRDEVDHMSPSDSQGSLSSREWIQRHRQRYMELCIREMDFDEEPRENHWSVSSLSDSFDPASGLSGSEVSWGVLILHGPLNRCRLLLPVYFALLISKSVVVFIVSTPISLLNPICAYALQSVGSRFIDVLIYSTMLLILFALQETPLTHAFAPSPVSQETLPRMESESWSSSRSPSPMDGLSYHEFDIESNSHGGIGDIIITDPAHEHSLEDLRAVRSSSYSREELEWQREMEILSVRRCEKKKCGSEEMDRNPLRGGYHFIERDPKEILDDLLTL